MINLSANGIIFGAETFRQAELTVMEAIAAGYLTIADSALGRDAILGTTIAAISTMLREERDGNYPEQVVATILVGLGVAPADAREITEKPLPALIPAPLQG